MIPSDIGPHPDAPDHYVAMRKPTAWSDKDCGTLTIRRIGVTGDLVHEPAARLVRDDLPSGESVYPSFLSEWKLTEEEKDRLLLALLENESVSFRLLVAGNGLPPLALWLRGREEV